MNLHSHGHRWRQTYCGVLPNCSEQEIKNLIMCFFILWLFVADRFLEPFTWSARQRMWIRTDFTWSRMWTQLCLYVHRAMSCHCRRQDINFNTHPLTVIATLMQDSRFCQDDLRSPTQVENGRHVQSAWFDRVPQNVATLHICQLKIVQPIHSVLLLV